MNFLAHLYLSGENPDVKVGNFIADSVKGRGHQRFTKDVEFGIILHRAIDKFTDGHPVVNFSKSRLRSEYGKHAGIVIDIFYDHFLSVDWNKYSTQELDEFIRAAYMLLINNYLILPGRVKQYLPFMVVNNWIEKYSKPEGIERVLNGMSKRTSLPSKTGFGMEVFHKQYDELRAEFNTFFPELIGMVRDEFNVSL